MATTSAFGWETPDDTDLVKDGAAAIRTLGNSIDTSMSELKGGTTGQILSKTSATDMDFTWVAQTSIPESYGFTAGKNKIINGDFSVNQRNFSSTTTSAEYNFDRWRTIYTGGTSTTSAQVFTPGTAPVAGYEGKNYYRVVITGQSATTDFVRMQEQVESVRTFAGQTTTYSFWAKASAGTPKVAVISVQGFGGGGSPSSAVQTDHGTITLSTSWARYSITCVIPSIAGKTLGTSGDDSVSVRLLMSAGSSVSGNQNIGVQNYTFETWGHQWEAGSVATAFQTATGTIQGELAACQRYYYRNTGGGAFFSVGHFAGTTANAAEGHMKLPVSMRVAPTGITVSGSFVVAGGGILPTVTFDANTTSKDFLGLTITSTSNFAQYRACHLISYNNAANYIETTGTEL